MDKKQAWKHVCKHNPNLMIHGYKHHITSEQIKHIFDQTWKAGFDRGLHTSNVVERESDKSLYSMFSKMLDATTWNKK